jgi:hypothetical protein
VLLGKEQTDFDENLLQESSSQALDMYSSRAIRLISSWILLSQTVSAFQGRPSSDFDGDVLGFRHSSQNASVRRAIEVQLGSNLGLGQESNEHDTIDEHENDGIVATGEPAAADVTRVPRLGDVDNKRKKFINFGLGNVIGNVWRKWINVKRYGQATANVAGQYTANKFQNNGYYNNPYAFKPLQQPISLPYIQKPDQKRNQRVNDVSVLV